jgi:hypothetical protein
VSPDDLKAYTAVQEAGSASGKQDSSEPRHGGRVGGTGMKTMTELENKDKMTSREL